jgi:glutathione-regulated potassium-efflux system ancillary protein KefG
VLRHGWAYGSQGKALEGKFFLQALTGGGDESTYRRDGYNGYAIDELISPLRAMSRLCNMSWLPPFAVLGIHRGLPEDDVRVHAEDYRRAVCALRDERLDLAKVQQGPYLNSDLSAVIREGL